jgi:hypothetical protein
MSWKTPYGGTRVHYAESHKNRFRKKIYGRSLCGIRPFRKGTDNKKFVTCKRCLKILEKNEKN